MSTLHYRGNVVVMKLATSRITAQGQLSIPQAVRRQLGLSPGSVVAWEEERGSIVVRRVGQFSSDQVHEALFASPPRSRSLAEMKDGVRLHMRRKHAGG